MSSSEKEQSSFESWMRSVDLTCQEDYGLSIHDLPDCPFRDWWEMDGMTPEEAAERAVNEELD